MIFTEMEKMKTKDTNIYQTNLIGTMMVAKRMTREREITILSSFKSRGRMDDINSGAYASRPL